MPQSTRDNNRGAMVFRAASELSMTWRKRSLSHDERIINGAVLDGGWR
jgi:hypothetical protein